MRPPECAVCGADEPSESFALVTCVATSADLAWRERAAREGLVGHPPDTGWFCGDHADVARELAPSLHLSDVVARVRAASAGSAPVQSPASGLPGPVGDSAGGAIGALYRALVAELPALAAGASIEPARLRVETSRDWHPMDRATPPHCPFVDTTRHWGEEDGAELVLVFEEPFWAPDDPTRTYLTLTLSGTGDTDFRVAAWSPASGAPHVVDDATFRGAVPSEIAMFVEVAQRS